MIQASSPAFFGKVVPLAGQRKPPTTSGIARLEWATYDREMGGRYLIKRWMENRCCNPVQLGRSTICMVDSYGNLVVVENRGAHGAEAHLHRLA